MAYFLFIDESGQDHRDSPYEVLAGVAVEDRDLWNLIQAIQDAELRHFGRRYSSGTRSHLKNDFPEKAVMPAKAGIQKSLKTLDSRLHGNDKEKENNKKFVFEIASKELKGKKILKSKVFRIAEQLSPIEENERRLLAKKCLENGASAGKKEMTALAQAKLAYVAEVFEICARFRCKVFASIVSAEEAIEHSPDHLRKDYAYLFERFFYFLEDIDATSAGIVVFDELEKSQSHILLIQMDRYFKATAKGKQRAGRIIPEPFFVHSDLTTGIQLADLAAYIISWGFRTKELTKSARPELDDFVKSVCQLRHRAIREVNDNPEFVIWSIGVIKDLRPKEIQCDDQL